MHLYSQSLINTYTHTHIHTHTHTCMARTAVVFGPITLQQVDTRIGAVFRRSNWPFPAPWHGPYFRIWIQPCPHRWICVPTGSHGPQPRHDHGGFIRAIIGWPKTKEGECGQRIWPTVDELFCARTLENVLHEVSAIKCVVMWRHGRCRREIGKARKKAKKENRKEKVQVMHVTCVVNCVCMCVCVVDMVVGHCCQAQVCWSG